MVRLFFLVLLASGAAVSRGAAPTAPVAPVAPVASAAVARPATEPERYLLDEAVRNVAADLNRWACTETTVIRDEKGRIKSESVVRYDPSQPYEEQWKPITVNGKEPSERDFAKYRKRGLQARRRDENPALDQRKSLGEVMQLEAAFIAEETEKELVFEVPLRKEGNIRFPPEKFQVLARINKNGRTLEDVAVRLRESFRSKLVLKVKSGDGTLDFTTINPKFAPVLTSIRGDASASILFVSVGGALDLQRSDFKRVKPYAERFDVQIGPLKALDF